MIYDDDDDGPLAVPKRPRKRRGQVWKPEHLIPGLFYEMHNNLGFEVIIVLTKPVQTGSGMIFRYTLERYRTVASTTHCADAGLIAYDNGFWSPTGWIKRLRKCIKLEELKKLQKKLL